LIHGIKTKDEVHIPFSLKGKSSHLYIRRPTAKEMEECEHIELTSDDPWDPTDVDWEENEEKFTRKDRHAWNAISSIHPGDEGRDDFDSMEQAIIDDMLSDLLKLRTM